MSNVSATVDGGALTTRQRWIVAGVIVGLALLFGMVEATQNYIGSANLGKPVTWSSAIYRTMPSWIMLAALTPIILFVAARSRLERGRLWFSIPIQVISSIAFVFLHLGGTALIYAAYEMTFARFPVIASRFITNYFALDILNYAAIVGAFHAFHYYRQLKAREVAASRLQASLTEAKLNALRGQLNPHFLFNTLNAISSMALKGEQESVVTTLGSLSELLRASLDERLPQEVPLAQELDFLDRYLEIQRMRFADRLTIEKEIDPETLDALVPSMLMQPLVENAVVHGIAPTRGPGRVAIRAVRENGLLCVLVDDTGPGFASAARSGERSTGRARGIGLANTRARLEQLYGADHSLELSERPGGGARVRVTIPWRAAEGERLGE